MPPFYRTATGRPPGVLDQRDLRCYICTFKKGVLYPAAEGAHTGRIGTAPSIEHQVAVAARGAREMRWLKVGPGWVAGVMLVAGMAGCASPIEGQSAPVPVAAAGVSAGPVPGTDPAIQRWFLDNDAAKVAFNDALLRAERGVASRTASECKPLSSAIARLDKVLPKLAALSPAGQRLAAAIQPAVTTFDSAATACQARNFPAAQLALDSGVVQQADAQATVDEILDGDL